MWPPGCTGLVPAPVDEAPFVEMVELGQPSKPLAERTRDTQAACGKRASEASAAWSSVGGVVCVAVAQRCHKQLLKISNATTTLRYLIPHESCLQFCVLLPLQEHYTLILLAYLFSSEN